MMKQAALTLLIAIGASAQGPIAGPVLGWVPDPARHAVRPLLGIPGAATLGEPVEPGFALALAAVSPAQNLMVVAAEDGGAVHLWDGSGAPRPLDGAPASPSRIEFSPAGGAVALYYEAARRIVVFRGLPKEPVLAMNVDFPGEPGNVGSFAASDDGAALLVPLAGAGRTLVVAASGNRWRLDPEGAATAVVFAPSSHDAVVAVGGSVLVHRDVLAQPPPDALAYDVGPVDRLAVTADGRVVAALKEGASVLLLGPAQGEPRRIECSIEPGVLAATSDPAVFRLNALDAGPLWLLDLKPEQPRLLFVPAVSREVEQ